MKVFVYYNLRKHVWSIRALEGENKNRVIGYAEGVYLTEAIPKVSENGRQRVLREKQKNVHAGIVGKLLEVTPESNLFRGKVGDDFTDYVNFDVADKVTYNPYKYDTFVKKSDPSQKMITASCAILFNREVYCYGLKTFE